MSSPWCISNNISVDSHVKIQHIINVVILTFTQRWLYGWRKTLVHCQVTTKMQHRKYKICLLGEFPSTFHCDFHVDHPTYNQRCNCNIQSTLTWWPKKDVGSSSGYNQNATWKVQLSMSSWWISISISMWFPRRSSNI